jgi:hypothetical protein
VFLFSSSRHGIHGHEYEREKHYRVMESNKNGIFFNAHKHKLSPRGSEARRSWRDVDLSELRAHSFREFEDKRELIAN